MTKTRLTRRQLLYGTAGLAVVGLAGCTGSSGATSGGSPDSSSGNSSSSSSGGDPPGHGESEHSHGEIGEPKESREVLVNTARGKDTTEYHFKPHVTRVKVGGTVTWRLESGTHTATAYHPGNDQPRLVPDGTEAWDSGTLSEKGQTYEHTFDTEGVYHYYCKPHEQFGMIATVIVGDPDPEKQAALQKIPADKPAEVRGKLKELNEMARSALEDGHHEEESEGGHHEEESEGGHHEDGTATPTEHHEGENTTESGHHEEMIASEIANDNLSDVVLGSR